MACLVLLFIYLFSVGGGRHGAPVAARGQVAGISSLLPACLEGQTQVIRFANKYLNQLCRVSNPSYEFQSPTLFLLTGLELTMYPRITLISWSSCLHLPTAGLTGVCSPFPCVVLTSRLLRAR